MVTWKPQPCGFIFRFSDASKSLTLGKGLWPGSEDTSWDTCIPYQSTSVQALALLWTRLPAYAHLPGKQVIAQIVWFLSPNGRCGLCSQSSQLPAVAGIWEWTSIKQQCCLWHSASQINKLNNCFLNLNSQAGCLAHQFIHLLGCPHPKSGCLGASPSSSSSNPPASR